MGRPTHGDAVVRLVPSHGGDQSLALLTPPVDHGRDGLLVRPLHAARAHGALDERSCRSLAFDCGQVEALGARGCALVRFGEMCDAITQSPALCRAIEVPPLGRHRDDGGFEEPSLVRKVLNQLDQGIAFVCHVVLNEYIGGRVLRDLIVAEPEQLRKYVLRILADAGSGLV